MGLDGYVGGFETQQRARKLQEERDRAKEIFAAKKQATTTTDDVGNGSFEGNLMQFRNSTSVAAEKLFASQSVGLLSREEYAEKQAKIEREVRKEKDRKEREKRAKRERERLREAKKRKKTKNLLSFASNEEEEEEETDDAVEQKKKRTSVGAAPEALSEHLPNRKTEIEEEELRMREELENEFKEKKQKQLEEDIGVTFSYWSSGGGRRCVKVKQKDTIRGFLKKAMKSMEDEFREFKAIDPSQMLYVKEDVIIPHEMTFYELISRKARGKSGPLFRFDDQEDVRFVNDVTKEKEDSHPGKVLHRSWYDKNKHIFPASRWEIFDFSKDFKTYTIHGAGQMKPWEK